MHPFQVVVGNVGTVYDGNNYKVACGMFNAYCEESKNNEGRAAGEPVTLMHKNEIRLEYLPPNSEVED